MNVAFGVALGVHKRWEALLGQQETEQLMMLLRELNTKLEEEQTAPQVQLERKINAATRRVS